jgi:hypothetical protein
MEAGIMAIMDVRDTLAEIKKKLFEPTIERRMAATPGSAPSSTVGGALMRKGKMKPGMKPGTKPAMKPKPGFVDVKIPPAMGTIVSALQSIQGVSANLGALGAIQMKVDELSDSYKSVNAEALAAAKAAANDANAPTNNAATANEAPANEAPANEAPANEAPANDAQEGGRRRRGTKRAMRNKRKRGTRR